ncbi:MAG: NUDIX hydrolase [Patescibacteria group bacterium]
MKTINKKFQLESFFGNFYRKAITLILIFDDSNNYYLGEKDFYPANIYRMVGGGLDKDEVPTIGAVRELEEETGLVVNTDELLPLIEFKLEGNTKIETKYSIVYVYAYKLKGGETLKANDDLSGIRKLDQSGLEKLINEYKMLNTHFEKGSERFSWKDYGAVYSMIHNEALLELNSLLK